MDPSEQDDLPALPDFALALVETGEELDRLAPEQLQQRPAALSERQYVRLVAEQGDIKTRLAAVKEAKARLREMEKSLESRQRALAWYDAAFLAETKRRCEARRGRSTKEVKSFDLEVGSDPLLPGLPSAYKVQMIHTADMKRRVEVTDYAALRKALPSVIHVELTYKKLTIEAAEKLERFAQAFGNPGHECKREESVDKDALVEAINADVDGPNPQGIPGVVVGPERDDVDVRLIRAKAIEGGTDGNN